MHVHDAKLMPGMLTPEQMAKLAAARGTEFDRLFLEFMIQHHEGALVMVKELMASPGAGQDANMFAFASDVEADQSAEITRMRVHARSHEMTVQQQSTAVGNSRWRRHLAGAVAVGAAQGQSSRRRKRHLHHHPRPRRSRPSRRHASRHADGCAARRIRAWASRAGLTMRAWR